MPFINADRIKETTITTGTGNIALLGAVLGFRAFYPTLSIGDTFKYFIVSTSGTEWESGLGTLTASSTLARTTVQSSSNANAAVNFSAGLKEVGIGPTAGGETPWNPVTNTLDISVNALNDVAINSPTVNQVLKYSGTEWTNQADAVNVGTVTSVSGAGTVSGLTLSGTVISSGSLTLGGTLSAIPLATGVSGTLPVANGGTGVTTSTGTTNVVLSNSPTLVTPLSNTLSAIPVASGAGNSLTIAAGSGVTSGAGGSLILQAGLQATSGGDGKVIVRQVSGQTSNLQEWQSSASTPVVLSAFDSSGRLVVGKGIATVGVRFQSHEESTQNINYFTTGGGSNSAHNFITNLNGVGRAGIIGFDYNDNVLKLIYGGSFGGQIVGLNINSSNNVGLGTVSPLAKLHAVAGSAATKGLIVQGAASQTANLQEWQDSAGTVLASVSAAGSIASNALAAIPVASGLTASVTAASGTVTGPNATITYTAAGHSFTVGRTVTVTNMTIVTGNSLNCAGKTIISVTSTTFTIADFIGSGSTSTATSAVANNATAGGNSFTNTASNAVTAGPGGNYHFKAGDGVGVGKGGDIEFELGLQGSSGGDGAVSFVHPNGYSVMKFTTAKQFNSYTDGVAYGWREANTGLRLNNTGNRYLTLSMENYNVFSISGSTLAATLSSGLVFTNTALAAGGSEVATGHFSFFSGNGTGVMVTRNGPFSATNGGSFAFPSSTTAIAVNTDNLVLTGSAFQRINCTAPSNLTGIAPPTGGTHDDGRMGIRFYNVGTANLTFSHNSGSSTSANRFWNVTAADIIIAPNDYAEGTYDLTNNGSGAAGWRLS